MQLQRLFGISDVKITAYGELARMRQDTVYSRKIMAHHIK
jgi:hypothetical protein